MAAYYNEFDPKTAAWLRELIKAGLIADGEVDTRSVVDVRPADLAGFTQCHFFAGIGGWSYALRLAHWDDARPVWTGSCPCQPFSSAGAQAGGHDPRDLWPAWFLLIRQCRPVVVFGEQVEGAIKHGWFDRVCDDLEAEDYAIGACGLPAPCAGAFHGRHRLWFVADAADSRRQHVARVGRLSGAEVGDIAVSEPGAVGEPGVVADTYGPGTTRYGRHGGSGQAAQGVRRGPRDSRRLGHTNGARLSQRKRDRGVQRETVGPYQGQASERGGHAGGMGESDRARAERAVSGGARTECSRSPWASAEWIYCRDSKWRPTESGTFPLAHGVYARVGRLRGYGNAIVPQVAQAFIEAYLDVTHG